MAENLSTIGANFQEVGSEGATQPATKGDAFVAAAVVLTLVAFAIRAPWFGSPINHIDEQYYLLVGDRILHGALPYVDLWDRKPFGLFLIYAAIRLLGGDGIMQYQVVATIFAVATAIIICRWVSRYAGAIGGVAAGLLYLFLLQRFAGDGGQAEVFMNLFLAAGGYLAWKCVSAPRAGFASLIWQGLIAMVVAGLAIQIKTTAIIPVASLGLGLIWTAYRAEAGFGRIAAASGAWAGAAWSPSLAAAGYYWLSGHLDAYVFANFQSIAMRSPDPIPVMLRRLASLIFWEVLPLAAAALAAALSWPLLSCDKRLFAWLGWMGLGCLIAFVAVGTFYVHYVLILAVVTALIFGLVIRSPASQIFGCCFLAVFAATILARDVKRYAELKAALPEFYATVDVVKHHVGDGSLYVYRGYAGYYYASQRPIPTRFAFPDHLSTEKEVGALGVPPADEVRRIFAQRPRVVIVTPVGSSGSPATKALVNRVLARDYWLARREGPAGVGAEVYVLRQRP